MADLSRTVHDLPTTLADFIWRARYRVDQEKSFTATCTRVADAAAAIDAEPAKRAHDFAALLASYRFLPGGRILAGAGTQRAVTLANCFVMGRIDDSLVGVCDALREGAVTLQQGGGIGFDFSTLRGYGTLARGVDAPACGPVAFLDVFAAMCGAIGSAGHRRGAMMATLRCDHPDIEAFIAAKRSPGQLQQCNLSVLVTDEFMQAVRTGRPWPLRFPAGADIVRTVDARELWQLLCTHAYAGGEPGVLFVDRINAANNLSYRESLSATNPCAEAPLPPYGACHLGSLNLPQFVLAPFDASARIDSAALAEAAFTAVRFLDNIVEICRYPLFRQATTARASRRIGLGVTGLADALAMLGERYDSPRARELAAAMLTIVRDNAYLSSIELARERGPCSDFERDKYLAQPFIGTLPESLRAGIATHGIRNSHLLAIAPAGTISLLAGNVSSGIEPISSLSAVRTISLDRQQQIGFSTTDYAYRVWRDSQPPGTDLPPALCVDRSIAADDQLAMVAALQPLVDGSISKTVTFDPDVEVSAVVRTFERAYELGLKGTTVYRLGSRRPVSNVATDAAPRGPC